MRFDIECLEHKLGKYMLPTLTKGIINILIICQLSLFVMVRQHVLTKFGLQEVDMKPCPRRIRVEQISIVC